MKRCFVMLLSIMLFMSAQPVYMTTVLAEEKGNYTPRTINCSDDYAVSVVSAGETLYALFDSGL